MLDIVSDLFKGIFYIPEIHRFFLDGEIPILKFIQVIDIEIILIKNVFEYNNI